MTMQYQRLFTLISMLFLMSMAYGSNTTIDNTTIKALTTKITKLEEELNVLKQQMHVLEENKTPSTPSVGVPIINSPYLGGPPAFNGSDLISSMPVLNQDVALMEQRQTLENQGLHSPIILMSGIIQPIFTAQSSYTNTALGAVSIFDADLEFAPILNPWVEGLLTFETGTSAYTFPQSQPPFDNTDLTPTIDNAFINIGNLQHTPLYGSAGQIYIPFGQSLTNMITYPMTYVQTQTRMMATTFGYSSGGNSGLSATASIYHTQTTQGQTAAADTSLSYQFNDHHLSGNISGSLISNIADSGGFQNTGGSDGEFEGFAESSDTEAIHQTPAYDFNSTLTIGNYHFLAEFFSTLRPFDNNALSYNGHGAQPMGINVEGAYDFNWLTKPTTIAFGYGWTGQSLALQLPQQRFSGILTISCWRNTLESIEFRHDIDYSSSDDSSGLGSTIPTQGSGSSADTVTLSFASYF